MLKTKPIETFEYKPDVSPKWQNITLENATDEQIDELINEIAEQKNGINLNVPFTMQGVGEFFDLFKCQNCGYCCHDAKDMGIVLLPAEVEKLAIMKGMSKRQFKDDCTIIDNDRRLMKYPCVFYDKKCTIYEDRPQACRLFPLNVTQTAKNFNPMMDGVALMIAHSGCPEGRRLAGEILKVVASKHTVDKQSLTKHWEHARKEQTGLRVY